MRGSAIGTGANARADRRAEAGVVVPFENGPYPRRNLFLERVTLGPETPVFRRVYPQKNGVEAGSTIPVVKAGFNDFGFGRAQQFSSLCHAFGREHCLDCRQICLVIIVAQAKPPGYIFWRWETNVASERVKRNRKQVDYQPLEVKYPKARKDGQKICPPECPLTELLFLAGWRPPRDRLRQCRRADLLTIGTCHD